jgi:hypothetical protein
VIGIIHGYVLYCNLWGVGMAGMSIWLDQMYTSSLRNDYGQV